MYMKDKKIPQRRCIGCGSIRGKRDLIRIAFPKDSEAVIDVGFISPGRGAYLCRDPECLKKARKKNALARALRCSISDEITDRIEAEIKAASENGS